MRDELNAVGPPRQEVEIGLALDARGFYRIIAVSVLARLGIQYLPISPMKGLFWAAQAAGLT